MRAPVFAYGSYEKLVAAVASGKVKYPTYCWLYDTAQYAFVNKKSEIEIVGLPKLTGTMESPLILSNLADGVYEVKGEYKVTEDSGTTFLSASYIIVIVGEGANGEKKVRRITADDLEDYVVEGGHVTDSTTMVTAKYLEEHHYATEGYVDEMGAALRVSIAEELKDYVNSIIGEQIAELVPLEVEKSFKPVPQDEINDIFEDG